MKGHSPYKSSAVCNTPVCTPLWGKLHLLGNVVFIFVVQGVRPKYWGSLHTTKHRIQKRGCSTMTKEKIITKHLLVLHISPINGALITYKSSIAWKVQWLQMQLTFHCRSVGWLGRNLGGCNNNKIINFIHIAPFKTNVTKCYTAE